MPANNSDLKVVIYKYHYDIVQCSIQLNAETLSEHGHRQLRVYSSLLPFDILAG